MLERANARFHAGEVVRGVVRVTVVEDCSCNALTVELGFRTEGKGDADEQFQPAQRLAAGEEWRSGETRSYPFEMTAPSSPLSYDGELVLLRWFVRARADLAWAADAKEEAEVVLVRAADPETEREAEPASFRGYRESARRSPPTRRDAPAAPRTLIFSRAVALLGFAAAGWGWSLFHSYAFESVALLFGVVGSAFAMRNKWTESHIGKPEVSVEPSRLRPGENLRVRLLLEPRRAVRVRAVWVEATAQERATDTRGDGSTTHTRVVRQLRRELAPGEGVALEAGERRTFEGEVPIPPGAPQSFKSSHNELQWSAVVGVDVEGLPEWVLEYDLSVS